MERVILKGTEMSKLALVTSYPLLRQWLYVAIHEEETISVALLIPAYKEVWPNERDISVQPIRWKTVEEMQDVL